MFLLASEWNDARKRSKRRAHEKKGHVRCSHREWDDTIKRGEVTFRSRWKEMAAPHRSQANNWIFFFKVAVDVVVAGAWGRMLLVDGVFTRGLRAAKKSIMQMGC
jgi:predicted NAD/FAD-dependent oxidoreductase